MQEHKPKYDHKLYKHVKDVKDADAADWGFTDPKNLVLYPYKFPKLPDDEVRIKVIYVGICYSDSHFCNVTGDLKSILLHLGMK